MRQEPSKPMNRPTCETCYFWEEMHKPQNFPRLGTCHRYPPTTLIGNVPKDFFPELDPDDWCGEHKIAVHLQRIEAEAIQVLADASQDVTKLQVIPGQ